MTASGSEPLLEAVELTVDFGGLRAVDGVSLHVPRGSLVGLIGPNGAGKTTTIDALTGFVPHRGKVRFGGRDVSDEPPHRRARLGMARTWQSLELFDDLTVRENCRVAADRGGARSLLTDLVRPSRRRDDRRVDWTLELLDLGPWADAHPGELPLGVRKLAAVARALSAAPAAHASEGGGRPGGAGAAVAGPELLLLDEPAAGLDSAESLALGAKLRVLIDEGISIFLIDHDMGLVLSVCDELYVLDFGRVIASGSPDEVRNDPRVVAAYLGETHARTAGPEAHR